MLKTIPITSQTDNQLVPKLDEFFDPVMTDEDLENAIFKAQEEYELESPFFKNYIDESDYLNNRINNLQRISDIYTGVDYNRLLNLQL